MAVPPNLNKALEAQGKLTESRPQDPGVWNDYGNLLLLANHPGRIAGLMVPQPASAAAAAADQPGAAANPANPANPKPGARKPPTPPTGPGAIVAPGAAVPGAAVPGATPPGGPTVLREGNI